MINPEDSNGYARLWFWAGITLMLTGCSNPSSRRIEFSDLESPNPTVKVLAIKRAGVNKISSAVPRLVDLLQDEDESVRFYAIASLRRITGTDNGYDYKAAPQRRAAAVERWREFLKSHELLNYEN
jgi:hypothetical protein